MAFLDRFKNVFCRTDAASVFHSESVAGRQIACVAWRFKQFELERTPRRSRENERRSRNEHSCLSPRVLEALALLYRGFSAFIAHPSCSKAAKLRRLASDKMVSIMLTNFSFTTNLGLLCFFFCSSIHNVQSNHQLWLAKNLLYKDLSLFHAV